MLSSFHDGFIDDLSFFLMCLWFRATPHLLHPTPFTKHHSICYWNSFCLRTIHAMCTFAFVRPDSLASKENQPKLTYYHYLPHICRNLGRFRQPTAFGALSLTIVDFAVGFAIVVACAFRTAHRGGPAASSRTCASSCQNKPHSCCKGMCYKLNIVVDISVRYSGRPNKYIVKDAHV